MSIATPNEDPKPELRPFLSEFIQDRFLEVRELESVVANMDRSKAGKIVHAWKGYSAPYGFGSLPGLGEKLLIALDSYSSKEAMELLNTINVYLEEKQRRFSDE